jgi:hypothetical protein
MAAAEQDIWMEQGATFRLGFTYIDDAVDEDGKVILDDVTGLPVPGDPRDFTGWSARMQVRQAYGTDVLVDLDDTDITLGADGTVLIVAGATKTDNLVYQSGRRVGQPIATGLYDMEVYDPNDPDVVDRLLEGVVHVDDNITRES